MAHSHVRTLFRRDYKISTVKYILCAHQPHSHTHFPSSAHKTHKNLIAIKFISFANVRLYLHTIAHLVPSAAADRTSCNISGLCPTHAVRRCLGIRGGGMGLSSAPPGRPRNCVTVRVRPQFMSMAMATETHTPTPPTPLPVWRTALQMIKIYFAACDAKQLIDDGCGLSGRAVDTVCLSLWTFFACAQHNFGTTAITSENRATC